VWFDYEDDTILLNLATHRKKADCLGRICRDVHRDLPAPVVIERLGDDLSRRSLVMHDRTPDPSTSASITRPLACHSGGHPATTCHNARDSAPTLATRGLHHACCRELAMP
jgi:hypothetical protein